MRGQKVRRPSAICRASGRERCSESARPESAAVWSVIWRAMRREALFGFGAPTRLDSVQGLSHSFPFGTVGSAGNGRRVGSFSQREL